MARDYSSRLASLSNRRLGLDDRLLLSKNALFLDSFLAEAEDYQVRGKTQAVKYALGSMQEIAPRLTEIYFEQAERVSRQLNRHLSVPVSFDYQGSVPLNIHIRVSSDIDLLVLHESFVNPDPDGPLAHTYVKLPGNAIADTLALRAECESILDYAFPEAKVDKTRGKAIAVSGGSLTRKVDVVPSHWHDSAAFQASGQKQDREVRVVDKHERRVIPNRPFLHIKKIDNKDIVTLGGTKKAIRLLKSLKRDSDFDIELSSYEIAGLVWHIHDTYLRRAEGNDLGLVAVLQMFLDYMVAQPDVLRSLEVPDGSRKIIESDSALLSLTWLSIEVDHLVEDIADESGYGSQGPEIKKRALLESSV